MLFEANDVCKLIDKLICFVTDYEYICIRDYIHVCDLAHAHVLALDYLFNNGQSTTLNCGYSEGFSVKDVVEKSQALFGDFPVKVAPRRDGDPPTLIANATKIKQILNWTPKFNDLDTIITSAIKFEQQLIK